LLRRNIITTALHGAGIYQFDLTVSGWFGRPGMSLAAHCKIIAQFPIENHSEQGQFAEPPLKTIGKVQSLGDYFATRSNVVYYTLTLRPTGAALYEKRPFAKIESEHTRLALKDS
jgi:hypothetical protein